MKITRVEAFLLYESWVYLKVETDAGISGWGEAAFHGGALTARAVEFLGEKVVGRDPCNTDAIWRDLLHSGYRIGILSECSRGGGWLAAWSKWHVTRGWMRRWHIVQVRHVIPRATSRASHLTTCK